MTEQKREKVDRRVRRTRELLGSALIAMILEKGYEHVTVQDIIDRADVGRSTFYAHFRDKEDLLVFGLEELRTAFQPEPQGDGGDVKRRTASPTLAVFEHFAAHREVWKAMAVHYPGDYGGDSAAGVAEWAKANAVVFDAKSHDVQTTPNAQAGNQDAAVGKSAAQGFKGQFVGSVPTFNPALLKSDAAPAIKSLYHFVSPWGPWGSDTPAHKAMQEAAGGKPPANDGYTSGWIWSYPLKAVLEKAMQDGDLTRAGVRSALRCSRTSSSARPPRTSTSQSPAWPPADRHRGNGQAVLRAAEDASRAANGGAATLRPLP